MKMRPSNVVVGVEKLIILLGTIHSMHCVPQDTTPIKPGRYIPELHGAHLGKYVPDDSGKYFHIHRPYDGGYGDTGIKYVHDASGNLVPLSTRVLGPKDHLRFMLDFNFDKSGWQIIHFQWLRDGDENYKYKYFNQIQILMGNDVYEDAGEDVKPLTGDESDETSSENVENAEGEYVDSFNHSLKNNKRDDGKNSQQLQQAMREVMYYIENNILPML